MARAGSPFRAKEKEKSEKLELTRLSKIERLQDSTIGQRRVIGRLGIIDKEARTTRRDNRLVGREENMGLCGVRVH